MGSESNILQDQHSISEAILIPVGTRVELEVDGIATKLESFCVGALPEECLIFKYPSITNRDPAISKLSEGNKITVRYADRGNVFAFQSELLGFVTTPVKLIFISYPTTISRHSLRKVQRVDYPLFAEVDVNDEQFEGLVKDISAKGCRLSIVANSASQSLPIVRENQTLSIRCALPGIETDITITGQAKSFHREDTRVTIGIAFHDIDPDVREKLASFLSSVHKTL